MPSFDFSLLIAGPYHETLLAGLAMSLRLLVISLMLALPLAAALALLRLSPWAPLRAFAWLCVEVQRNIPPLAHLLFWYFAAPELLPEALRDWLYGHNFEAIAAVVALTLYAAAFMGEDLRSGIRSVPAVQFEAGRALGLGFLPTMRFIILPQALRIATPPLLSQTLNLWKNSSLATVIGTAELMYAAAKVETETFRSFEAFAFATVCYLTVSLAIGALAAWFARRYPPRSA
ncbi:amino acid ABC transporter permease [Hylemonella gracilis]|uniref:Polar amino acid ABC transporter, inner membrane subunit n=1 Tax=Hylemonella gracilis ATCC 19624 TaxID=887062 RepID=F3KR06_9BURK|nr:amino acid ABC transporter permease [Hylemonella gracilis]EGI77707.1 polar amino acid ABC transporter, inner membrane subunit [Hylemonella gracilis ATCC 19624]